jgi:hypothetical protein
LLPQPVGVLARELVRELIDATEALDGHQKGLVRLQARFPQRVDLVSQMALQFLDVGSMNRLTTIQIGAPLLDLVFEIVSV